MNPSEIGITIFGGIALIGIVWSVHNTLSSNKTPEEQDQERIEDVNRQNAEQRRLNQENQQNIIKETNRINREKDKEEQRLRFNEKYPNNIIYNPTNNTTLNNPNINNSRIC